MAKRKPLDKLIPHLRRTDTSAVEGKSKKRQGRLPRQTSLSVQDVRDYSTPQGAALANDEMRRIREAITEAQAEIAEISKPQASLAGGVGSRIAPDGGGLSDEDLWALTVKHNDNVVGKPSVVQILNFLDGMNIKYEVTQSQASSSKYTTIDDATQINISPNLIFKIITGTVYINRLPLDPATRVEVSEAFDYLYEGYYYTPDYGYYGWNCYQLLSHNMNLVDSNSYILHLVDFSDVDDSELSDVEELVFASRFQKQVNRPLDVGLNNNAILLRSVFKPDLSYYRGGDVAGQSLEWVSEEERIFRTNLIFRYTLIGRIK